MRSMIHATGRAAVQLFCFMMMLFSASCGIEGGPSMTKLAVNPTLSSFSISVGTLTPSFSSDVRAYTADVPFSDSSLQLTLDPSQGGDVVKVNGVIATSPTSVSLSVGVNTITVSVIASNGTQTEYTLTVTRTAPSVDSDLSNLAVSAGALDQVFSTALYNYNVSVGYTTSIFSVTPTTDDQFAAIQVNGTTVGSGSASGNINLNVGANTITVAVTAEDGTVSSYILTVTRAAGSANADLTDLTISAGTLSPTFAAGTTIYSVEMSDIPTAFTVTPTASHADATIQARINAAAFADVVSGSASSSLTPVLGSNSVQVVVTAQNGSTKTYTIMVTYGTCGLGYYSDGVSACAQVGLGYWSAVNNNNRVACSNKPANSRYTSPTASASNCPWSCDDGYLTTNGSTCAAYPNALNLSCDNNEIAVGLYGRSGSIIDRLGVRCATFSENGTLGAVRNGPTYGGNGGAEFNYTGANDCPANSVLYEVTGSLTVYSFANRTGIIRFRCKSLANGTLSSWSPDWGTEGTRGPFGFSCGNSPNLYGEYMNGIIIDNASGASYTGDTLGINCR